MVSSKDGWIGEEVNEGSGVLRARPADRLERPGAFAAAVGLLVDRPVAADLHPEPGGERVHDRNAHPVQAGGVLVGVGVELAAGMQPGHHHLDRRKPRAGLRIHRNSPAVVAHRQAAVLMDGHPDAAAVTRHRFVDAVVHHLPEEVMQPGLARGADVHRGPDPHGLETLEDLDVPAGVLVRRRQYGAVHVNRRWWRWRFSGNRLLLAHWRGAVRGAERRACRSGDRRSKPESVRCCPCSADRDGSRTDQTSGIPTQKCSMLSSSSSGRRMNAVSGVLNSSATASQSKLFAKSRRCTRFR